MSAALLLVTLCALGGDVAELGREVRGVLAERCFRCHGPDVQKKKLRLDRREGVLGERGAVVAGDLAASELWLRVASDDPDERMPPAEAGPALSADELALVRAWIEGGAPWREHWAFEP
ncbi:MAG: c-type cytochrome domain-containing protein, partial [Planctomycetota bacterium]